MTTDAPHDDDDGPDAASTTSAPPSPSRAASSHSASTPPLGDAPRRDELTQLAFVVVLISVANLAPDLIRSLLCLGLGWLARSAAPDEVASAVMGWLLSVQRVSMRAVRRAWCGVLHASACPPGEGEGEGDKGGE